MSKKTLYTPEEYAKIMAKLSKILEAENVSFSHWVRLQAEAYVQAHENPPQQPQAPTAGSTEEISVCAECGAKAVHYGVKNNRWFGFCDAHFDKRKFTAYKL